MTTNRVPVVRLSRAMITPKVLQIFSALERARRARLHADCVVAESGYCTHDCTPCKAWWDAHAALHDELRLDPWIWPCIPFCQYPPGSPGAREWRPDAGEKALYDLLAAARRAAMVSRPSSPLDGEDTDANVDTGPEPRT
jgi:hypothetical protein